MGASALALFAGLILGTLVCWLVLGRLLAPKRRGGDEPFDWGEHAVSAVATTRVAFALLAIGFAVISAALVLLVPWSVAFGELGRSALLRGLPPLIAVGVGLVYAWLCGALEWEPRE